ncbi:MAG: lipoprotein transmembrane [Deltaproteobacteria bacterium RIFCSPLOWO2_02_FULL_53_8]|nr:MAG: lipoprotein transmembrane [Deltaproteobacteria bacterium RIFCSPLOWO2_02_FULL_53_8]
MSITYRRKLLVSIGALATACAMPSYAMDVSGVKVEDTASVGGKTLVLNGASMRQILFVKIYAIGLYVEKKSSSAAEILTATGPKRIALHIQREVNSDEFGQLFITSMSKNSTKEEKAKVVAQTTKFGEMFADMELVKKGDVIWLDWVPGKGTVTYVNGKQIGETLPDHAFYQSVIRIWLGGNPPQSNIKPALLGEK